VWGWLSDRHGPRGVLLSGLLGFGVTMLVFSFVESLAAVYTERFLSGMFTAAVTPVAAAVMGSFMTTEQSRARRLAFINMASIAGFLLGPMLGVFVTSFMENLFTSAMPAPPHDATGHTWHHTDSMLFSITKYGLLPGKYAPPDYRSDMPAFIGTLSDEEIWAVLAYIKSFWPQELRKAQRDLTLHKH
jgi:MFS family permease